MGLGGVDRRADGPRRLPGLHLGQSGALYDVVLGRNGSCGHLTICRTAVGYDGPTGVGSPTGLAAFSP
jgi:hypothetical protein